MNITKKLLPIPSQRSSGEKMDKVLYVVSHDTGTINSTAQNNVDWYIKTANDIQASAHYFVDDTEVICCIEDNLKAWSVRYDAGIAPNVAPHFMNDCAIAVELCYFSDLSRTKAAYDNYVNLIAELCSTHGIDPHTGVVGHYQLDPSRRTDPMNAFALIGKTWDNFIEEVSAIITSASQTHKSMDNTETAAPAAKTVLVKCISVTFDVVDSAGTVLTTGDTVNITVTPELLAALKLEDAALIEGGYDISVVAA